MPEFFSATEQAEKNTYEDYIACRMEEKIDSLFERFRKYSSFQGNVLVSWKGRIVYHNSHGYSNPRKKEPLSQGSVFQLASVSKQFTAMAIMILKEQGKLDFDDDVRKYITDWPYENMSIRHLLNHTAGLQNYMWLVEHKWKGENAPYNDEVISMLIEHQLPLNYTPGKYFAYSNSGYVVLAHLTEVISGEQFADFLHKHIFKPLGMYSSFAYSSVLNNSDERNKMMGYRKYWKGYREIPETVNDGCIGDKGIYSTTMDLYKWDQALYTEALVSRETIELAFDKARLNNNKRVSYGFGFRIEEDGDNKTVYHHGLWNGFRTSLMRYVNESSSIIVLNHTNSNAKHHLVRRIENILLEKYDDIEETDQLANFDSESGQESL